MIDCRGGDRQDREDGEHREDRHEQEYGTLAKDRADRGGDESDDDVAAVVAGHVAPHATGQLIAHEEAEGQRRHGRSEDIADDSRQRIRRQHRPEARCREDHNSPARKNGEGHDQSAVCRVGLNCRRMPEKSKKFFKSTDLSLSFIDESQLC